MLLANFNGKEHLRHRAVSLRQHGFLVIKLFGVCKNFSVLELKNRLLALLSWSRLDVLEYYSQQPTKLATQPTTCNQAWNCYAASVTGIAGHWHYPDFPFPIPQVPPNIPLYYNVILYHFNDQSLSLLLRPMACIKEITHLELLMEGIYLRLKCNFGFCSVFSYSTFIQLVGSFGL